MRKHRQLKKLERQPGKRDSRDVHWLSGEVGEEISAGMRAGEAVCRSYRHDIDNIGYVSIILCFFDMKR
ncbi:MAG: hypothetical protein HRU20_28370 [Pseudomonadales bacterium]|nr:hypothetical protein [Pseudomonadales bacterium]